MEQQNIGKFICAKRKEKNLTQEQLAEKLGVSNKTISKWENGKCMPDYAVVELLCEVLEITIAELLAGKESIPSTPLVCDSAQMDAMLYKQTQLENKVMQLEQQNRREDGQKAIGIGCALAIVISYVKWHSIGWAILHGFMSWGYVIYYLIRY